MGHVVGLRDRVPITAMGYSFARVSAVVHRKVEDYNANCKRWWLRLHEKGGKFHDVPVRHKAEGYLDAYIAAAGIAGDRKGPLFRSTQGKTRRLTDKPMGRTDVLRVIECPVEEAELTDRVCCHTFRATGINAYLEAGGMKHAQAMAAHESPRTTKRYDRTSDQISLDEIERIQI